MFSSRIFNHRPEQAVSRFHGWRYAGVGTGRRIISGKQNLRDLVSGCAVRLRLRGHVISVVVRYQTGPRVDILLGTSAKAGAEKENDNVHAIRR